MRLRKMTEKSLNEAFAGESMAHMRYLAFSDIAEREGYRNIARLFQAIAYAEYVHAINHARELKMLGSTVENLKMAIEGEKYEVEEMYPAYDAIAQLQNEDGAHKSIHYAIEAEKVHAELYTKALEGVKNGNDLEVGNIYICPICGYTHIGAPIERCPICGIPWDKFKKF